MHSTSILHQAAGRLEEQKLNDTSRFSNLGEADPTPSANSKLLDSWRDGEDKSYVTREECYDVMGLCEKKNGKTQRLSTLSDFKPRTPYFYGLLKIHKLDPSELKPNVRIPIRLVTDLSHAVTSPFYFFTKVLLSNNILC